MENLILEPGAKTPSVKLDTAGYLEFKGKSIPENSSEYYQPIYKWIDDYSASPQPSTKVLVELEYFNTSSSKCILDIFRKLEALNTSGKSKVSISWLYDEDDEDMMETGEDYKAIVNLPFVISKSTT